MSDYDNESELDSSDGQKQERPKAPTPLTKSGIEDLPSTVITSIYCADGPLDNVPDEVFAWKKAPAKGKMAKEKQQQQASLTKVKAPSMKTGDQLKVPSSSQVVKTNSKLQTVKVGLKDAGRKIGSRKVQLKAASSRDSLLKRRKAGAGESKQNVADKRDKVARNSSTNVKPSSSRQKLNNKNNKK